MLRTIVIFFSILFFFYITPHGLSNVYAAGNSADKSVSECLKSQVACQDNGVQNNKEKKSDSSSVDANPFSIFTLFKMILALVFVLFLIYFLLKLVNRKGSLFSQYRSIQNVGGTSLGQNRSIQLVKIGNRILIVGVAESIQLLKEIEDDDEIKEILEDYNQRLDHLTNSKNAIIQWVKNKKTQLSEANDGQNQFGTLLKEQLLEFKNGRKKLYEQIDKKGNEQNE